MLNTNFGEPTRFPLTLHAVSGLAIPGDFHLRIFVIEWNICNAASINCNAAKEEDLKHWIEFHNFLLQRMAYKTAKDTELYKLLNVPS
jgi:hypothetical protein